MSSKKPLRFAALIRVSSEKQERQGESLRTQAKQIEDAVAQLGGTITKRYAGQEHATPGWEREQMKALLADAAKDRKPFDAVMVADPSRWSRDNEMSKGGLRTLRENGIRFFTLTTEHNLYDPNAVLFLGMAAEIGEYQANIQSQKSILNRINRAKRGLAGAGSKPYGRTYDKKTGTWGIDREKQKLMEEIAKRYIAGESLKRLAAEYGLEHTGLHVNLTQRCGPKWTQSWNVPRLNINETVVIDVPPLLPDETIRAIQERVKANTTYAHGRIKNRFLLSRMVFCGHCGSSLSGHNQNGRLYYEHFWKTGRCLKGCVRADEIEAAVMRDLFDCFGNPVAVQRAIEEATPNAEEVAEARQRLARIETELAKVAAGRDRVLGFVAKGTVTEAQAQKQLEDLNDREDRLAEEKDRLLEQVGHVPDAAAIKTAAQQAAAAFKGRVSAKRTVAVRDANADLDAMTWEEKRALVEAVFGGKTPDGRRMGVYVERIDGQKDNAPKVWKYTIRGHLIDAEGVTMSLERLAELNGEPDGAAPGQRELATKLGRWSQDR